MPEKIGPQMLAKLDQQRTAGSIDRYGYEARKIEIVELIRRGRAVKFSVGEKVFWTMACAVGVLVGATLLFEGGDFFLIVVGLAIVASAIARWWYVISAEFRRRVSV